MGLRDLSTPWGETLDPERPLPEYPRPQMVRTSYLNLNGSWRYAITTSSRTPDTYDGDIIVPFSPEAALSGVGRQLQPNEFLHYERTFVVPEDFARRDGDRVLLHFGAVDQWCRVTVNDVVVGRHTGGYLPFALDITDAVTPQRNTLLVLVRDPSDTGVLSRGKQRLRRGGIWYTAQSGIWQTVWLECVPSVAIDHLAIVPHVEQSDVAVTVHAVSRPDGRAEHVPVTVEVRTGDVVLASVRGVTGQTIDVPLDGPRLWSPEDPFLYDLGVETEADAVRSYFGMRTFAMRPDAAGLPRLHLNGRPYFHAGVLDQGYWSDGLYTPPSDEAIEFDIATMKDLGFTMLRKHIKVEPLRWYYHCDRLGMLVWQDMVNGGGRYRQSVIVAGAFVPLPLSDRHHRVFARDDAWGREQWLAEMRATIDLLRNVPSIAMWVPFNEGWGQFDALAAAAEVRRLDPSRTVDHVSGWYDQGGGDVTSRHVYFRPFRVPRRKRRTAHRALVLSEYGGYSQRLGSHAASPKEFGYKRFSSATELAEAYQRLHERQIVPAVTRGLSASVYTQLSDVEDETNGLLTYDRRVVKFPAGMIREINARLTAPPD